MRGLSQHRRRAHPQEYHAQNVPVAKLKARWDHEELLILARAEITLRLSGVRNVNQQLARITPGRTLEAIKGVRKSTKYRELLASLEQQEAEGSEFVERNPSDPAEGAPDDIPEDPIQAPPDPSVEWAGQVRNAIYHLGVPDGIDLDAISPGNPNDDTRAMLDAEYAWWLPPLAGSVRQRPPGQRTGAPRVRTGQLVRSARAKRRAAYSRTQRLFKISRKRCARNVLSGTWEEEPSPVPMALQEPYWRSVFETASKHDNRRPPPKGPVEWSLVAPITVEDVTRAIIGMSDGVPGPDLKAL